MKLGLSWLAGAPALAIGSTLISAAPPSPPPPPLATLEPGGFRPIAQTLPVNIVFVGYEAGAGVRDINEAVFRAGLPATYASVNRAPAFYGLPAGTGVHFAFEYNIVYASAPFEDNFFTHLNNIAVAQPLTLFQDAYNGQAVRSQTVTSNAWIDAPSVEDWLGDNASTIGINPAQYTIFFINWYGRGDFKFHVYTKLDEPDPDTGFNFGRDLHSRKLIAWGGTTPDDEESGPGELRRIWFYDLSAGPEAWTDNWNITDADLDGNGRTDYRMPPIWEYGNSSGYRPFDNLSGDLAKVARYVAIDLLFTTSPLYKTAISPPGLPDDIQVDINVYDGHQLFTGASQHDLPLIVSELNELQPYNTYSAQLGGARFDQRASRIYDCFVFGPSCFGARLFGISFADLFLYHQDQLLQYLEGDAGYEVPVFAYNVADSRASGFLGFADDNWTDGTQSFVFSFVWPALNSRYGFTTTTIHEVGHHVGMSHPHDGYDAERGLHFGPVDEYYFAWSGDESNTVMSYIDLNWDFSQFDRDNMNRHMAATYLNQANQVLRDVYRSTKAGQAGALLTAADADAASALAAYAAMNYLAAATAAKSAYGKVLQAAQSIQVPIEPQAWTADYKAKGVSRAFVDAVDYQRMKP